VTVGTEPQLRFREVGTRLDPRSGLLHFGEMWSFLSHGYAGLVADSFVHLGPRDVGRIIECGGTMLGSKRYPGFKSHETQLQALRILHERNTEALIVIGGDGSHAGELALSERGFPVVGIASTIDNDLYGSDIFIGADTAVNTALERPWTAFE